MTTLEWAKYLEEHPEEYRALCISVRTRVPKWELPHARVVPARGMHRGWLNRELQRIIDDPYWN